MNKTKIVIIGGGFGGVYTALNLIKSFNKDNIDIILINKSNYFLFTPLLHEVATGGLTPDSIIESVREVFRGTPVNIVEDTVMEIDRISKQVKTSSNNYSYDYLVLSTGAETNYYGTTGAKEHSFTLKTLQDAITLRNHIVETCEKAVQTNNKELLVTAIIGAGPTGVELAAEVLEYMQHTIFMYYKKSGFVKNDIQVNLITSTSDVISQFPSKMREIALDELLKKGINVYTNTFVSKIEDKLITFKDGRTLKAHTIVWVAGVTAGPQGRTEINSFMQTISNPEVFALGDVAGKYPMLAQVAVQQAKTVAYNIYALKNKIPLKEFVFKQKGLLISIGQWYAIGSFGSFVFRGKIMWMVWRIAYLSNFISWRKKFEIASEWTTNLFYPRDITYLK